jgi:hypothetical protein
MSSEIIFYVCDKNIADYLRYKHKPTGAGEYKE